LKSDAVTSLIRCLTTVPSMFGALRMN